VSFKVGRKPLEFENVGARPTAAANLIEGRVGVPPDNCLLDQQGGQPSLLLMWTVAYEVMSSPVKRSNRTQIPTVQPFQCARDVTDSMSVFETDREDAISSERTISNP
jgi:hypothetical protein